MESLLKHHSRLADGAAMKVGGTHALRARAHTAPVRASGRAHAHAGDAHRGHEQLTPRPAPAIPAVPGTDTGPVSKAGGVWEADMLRARHDARIVLDAIDWSKPDIVLWVPGTDNHGIHPAFEDAARESWSDGSASLVHLRYPGTWDLRTSLPTGIATLKIVLAAIKARGGNHRVLLAGESQGAWVIGEAMADPQMRSIVTRAIIFGHPFIASHHYDDGHDPGIAEIANRGDQITMPIHGDPGAALDAMTAIYTLKLWRLGTIGRAMIENPAHIPMLAATFLRSFAPGGRLFKDPHDYTTHMPAAVEYLRFGTFNDGTDPASDNAALEIARRRARLARALEAQQARSMPA